MRTSLKFTFLSTVFLLYTFSTQAQQASEVVNQQDWLTRNQQNILEETKRNHEFLAIKKDRKRQQEEEEDGTMERVRAATLHATVPPSMSVPPHIIIFSAWTPSSLTSSIS